MKLGLISDTHDQLQRTMIAVDRLVSAGVERLIHCGDFCSHEVLTACCALPLSFVFGNNDWGVEPELRAAADAGGAQCLGYGAEIIIADRRISITHGHLHTESRPLMAANPDYLITGHSHVAMDRQLEATRWVNPGALHRASEYSVAVLDLASDQVDFITIPR
ncbi:MAG TPA: metallophosphoesterase [Planctomycetaceae bacterium]|nr:metallophosphoesterase [Planctomycetaceae bacterium]